MARKKELKTSEEVAPNLIPMVDIMFLLLLFFMLGADMTQRELAEVKLPEAEKAKPDERKPGAGQRTNVNISHRTAAQGRECAVHHAGGVCRDEAHWIVTLHGEVLDERTLLVRLRAEAALEMEPPPTDPEAQQCSARRVMIRADGNAPYLRIYQVLVACKDAALYRIEVGAAQPSKAQL